MMPLTPFRFGSAAPAPKSEAAKRLRLAARFFRAADESKDERRALRLLHAGYAALRRAMAVNQSIGFGAPYPGWKALNAFYRKRIEAMCAETGEEKTARKALNEAKRSLKKVGPVPQVLEELRVAMVTYARVVGITLRLTRGR